MAEWRRWTVAVVLLAAACTSVAADHETLGDRAYASRDYRDALVEYRLALRQASNARVMAKTGAAALHAEDLNLAAEEYAALAHAARDRRGEAADGLERVARAALAARDRPAFTAALAALRALSSARASAIAAQDIGWILGDDPPGRDLLDLLPAAAARASDARRQDSLMYVYGSGLARLNHCDQAMPAFQSVARRQRGSMMVSQARRGAAQCALVLGGQALTAGQPDVAEDWFQQAAADVDDEALSRSAYLGLGDVRQAKGDLTGAAESYQRALLGAQPGDSIAQAAAQRLNALARGGTGNQ